MFKKILFLPSDISKNQITNWCQRFLDFAKKSVNTKFQGQFIKDITLEFSDDIVLSQFNTKTLDEAKKEIKKRFNILICIKEKFESGDIETIRKMASTIAEANIIDKEESYRIICDTIENILDNTVDIKSRYGLYKAGSYCYDANRIVLYNKVITLDSYQGKLIEQAYEEVLAHELFHAIHYHLVKTHGVADEIIKRIDYTSSVIKESLASYFEYNYCKEYNIVTDIETDWKNNSPTNYPYSGAKYLFNPNFDMFNEVLSDSYFDFDIALRHLLYSSIDEFYNVKNIITIKNSNTKSKANTVNVRKISKYKFEDILEKFEKWITNGKYQTGTTKCYANFYMKCIVQKILNPWFKKQNISISYDVFSKNTNNKEIRDLIKTLSEYIIENELKHTTCGLSKKTIMNYRSGLRVFFSFLEAENYFFECKATKKDIEKYIETYSQSQIKNNFIARVITQDRAYEHMIYPARILNQIFNNSQKKKDYKKLLSDKIENIKFLISNDASKYVLLKDISGVEIQPQNLKAKLYYKGQSYDLYTEKSSNNKSKYELLPAENFSDLSLDHDIPLQNILDNASAQNQYKYLKQLSNMYAQYVLNTNCTDNYLTNNYKLKGELRNFHKLSGKFYCDNQQFFTTTFIDSLYNDLEKLFSNINFTIMYRTYNSSKGKRKI